MLNDKIGELYYVESEENIISAVFISIFRNKIVFLFGAHSDKALRLRSSTLVLDHILKKYADQHYIFDFEGSDSPNLARYYSSFGAERVCFYEFRKNELPYIIQVVKKLRSKLIKMKNSIFQ